jgi:hypothetical protein
MTFLVDPSIVTNYHRTDAELELYWLFCQVVAGKTARTQAKSLERFLLMENTGSPFDRIRTMVRNDTLVDNLKESRLGQYTRLAAGFSESVSLNLRTVDVAGLKAITGVGDKTARFFLIHSRPNQEIAVLDRHIVKYLGTLGYDVPEGTPSPKQYPVLEQAFLTEAKKVNMTPADFDLMLWNQFSKK